MIVLTSTMHSSMLCPLLRRDKIEYELQAHTIAEFPSKQDWYQLLDDATKSSKGGWPERLKRGSGRASLADNPLIDTSMGGPPREFVSDTHAPDCFPAHR